MSDYLEIRHSLVSGGKTINQICEETKLQMGKVMKIIHRTHKKHFCVIDCKIHIKRQKEGK